MRKRRAFVAALLLPALSGCAVVTVASGAVSVGAKVVGAAVDVTVGAVKVTGKAIGSAVDAISGADEPAPAASAEAGTAK
jgi:hypothetical protein